MSKLPLGTALAYDSHLLHVTVTSCSAHAVDWKMIQQICPSGTALPYDRHSHTLHLTVTSCAADPVD